MKLKVNGKIKELDLDTNERDLESVIKQLGHHPRLVVVEFNGTILPPKDWTQQRVKDGDNLEIVTIVGGGS